MLIFLTTLVDTLPSMLRSRAALELENLALRHQVVLQRSLRLTHRQGANIYLRMAGKVFGLGCPIITVVQTAQPIMGKHATRG